MVLVRASMMRLAHVQPPACHSHAISRSSAIPDPAPISLWNDVGQRLIIHHHSLYDIGGGYNIPVSCINAAVLPGYALLADSSGALFNAPDDLE